MQLEITIAGYASNWTFRGSRTFHTWAEAKPWSYEGGLCVIRTESADVADLIIPSIRRVVHGANSGEARLDVRRLEVGGAAGTPTQALLREFELDPAISPFEARDKIRTCLLGNRPTKAVFDGRSVQMSTSGRSNPNPTRQV